MIQKYQVSIIGDREITLVIEAESNLDSIKERTFQAYLNTTQHEDSVRLPPSKIIIFHTNDIKRPTKGIKLNKANPIAVIELDQYEKASLAMSLNQELLF